MPGRKAGIKFPNPEKLAKNRSHVNRFLSESHSSARILKETNTIR